VAQYDLDPSGVLTYLRRMRRLVLLGLVLALATVADAGRLRKPKRGFQMRAGEVAIQPGQDVEFCEYRRLPIRKAMDVAGFTLQMPSGAHHFAMWAYGGQIEDDSRFPQGPAESVGCVGFAPDEPFPQLMIPTTSPNTRLRFPPGVALRLEPHQQVLLNFHMKNLDGETITPDIRFNFKKAKKGSVRHHAEGLTFGTIDGISIPAGGDQTLTAEWTTPINLTLVNLTTHQHRLGTYANIELVTTDGGREMLVETFDWEHPSSVWPTGGIRLEKGRKVRVTCSWRNTDARTVRFGPETTDEMCFAIGFFYRDPGDTTPVAGSGCLPSRQGLLCPLAPVVHD
jgi:Copper type II ascorbate-dependent monooxygenase, C-terminal domain